MYLNGRINARQVSSAQMRVMMGCWAYLAYFAKKACMHARSASEQHKNARLMSLGLHSVKSVKCLNAKQVSSTAKESQFYNRWSRGLQHAWQQRIWTANTASVLL